MFSEVNHRPAPGFSQPLELFKACHEKIMLHAELLVKLCKYLQCNPVDSDALKTAEQIRRYFSTSAGLHHLDEDQNLFPALIDKADLNEHVRQQITQLGAEHTLLGEYWETFEQQLQQQALKQLPDMLEQAVGMKAAYRKHIDVENGLVLPEAHRLLNSEELAAIGQAMQKRRQHRH